MDTKLRLLQSLQTLWNIGILGQELDLQLQQIMQNSNSTPIMQNQIYELFIKISHRASDVCSETRWYVWYLDLN